MATFNARDGTLSPSATTLTAGPAVSLFLARPGTLLITGAAGSLVGSCAVASFQARGGRLVFAPTVVTPTLTPQRRHVVRRIE